MHAREMICRSFSESNTAQKEKEERSNLNQELQRVSMILKIFIDQNKKGERGRGMKRSQIELHFQDSFIFKFNHS